jgi:signal transduction histidine kinase
LKQNVRLIKKLSRRLPQIFLDEKFLKEAFLNLILNAVEAMPRGGRLAITAYYDHNAEEIVTTFCDSGCGITEDNLSRIFYPFFTTKKEGTGFGLSLARQVIELHKGKIHIESKPDYGTEVTVRLPVYEGMVSEDEKNPDS